MKRRWIGVLLLFVAGIINFLDRNALPLAAPTISSEFNLNATELGLVLSSFFVGYTIFCYIGGYYSDRYGPHRVFSIAMVAWSFFCGLTAAATGFISLVIVRIFFGAGEGPFTSNTSKFVSNWFPRREAATAMAMANAGAPIGGAIAGPLITMFIAYLGWRLAFVGVAVLGFVWLAFWLALSSNQPETDARVTPEELTEITSDRGIVVEESDDTPLRHFLLRPSTLATAWAFFGLNYVLYFFLSWFPSYLTRMYGMDLKSMGVVTVIPWICSFVGLLAGGVLSDLIYRWTGNLLFSRKVVLVTFMSLSAVAIVCAGLATTIVPAVVFTSIGMFLLYLTGITFWTIIQAVTPANKVGGVGGFVHALANIAGIIGPTLTGMIVDATGSFAGSFVLAGCIAISGAMAVLFCVKTGKSEYVSASAVKAS